MTQFADRVHADAESIDRLSRLVAMLPDASLVDIVLVDGSRMSGAVTVRPSLQTFVDASGKEGINAVLRLDDNEIEGHSRYLWLDEILDIRPVHSDQRSFQRPAAM